MINDRTPYYEVYNRNGDVLAKGTTAQIAKVLGVSLKTTRRRIYKGKRGSTFRDGIDIVEVGELRFVYDMYRGGQYIDTGTFNELSEATGESIATLKYSSSPSAHQRAGARKSENITAILLYRHEEPRIDYY